MSLSLVDRENYIIAELSEVSSLLLRQFITFMTNSLHKKVVLSTLHVLEEFVKVSNTEEDERDTYKVGNFFCFNFNFTFFFLLIFLFQILESQVVFYGLSFNCPPLILFFSNCSTKAQSFFYS
jgi:hypothetical protein